jgi:phytoene dehydrogenase-like protein
MRESFDVIVLGDELAGLVAATLCARRGMRVLLAQVAPRPASYTLGGVRLPTEPLLLPGLGSAGVRRVLEELHFHHLVKRKLRSATPAFQLVGPDCRIDIDADDAMLGRELGRELGEDHPALGQIERAGQLSAALDRVLEGGALLPPSGFWAKRELGRLAGPLATDAAAWGAGHGDVLGATLARLPAALSTSGPGDPTSDLAIARTLDLFRQGAPRLIGDLDALREMFLDKFVSHSGEVRVVEPASIGLSWNKVQHLRLASGEELGTQHLIAAMPIAALEPLLEGKAARRIAELAATIAPAGYRTTLHLVLDAIGIPEGMGSLVFAVSDPEAPLGDGNAFVLHAAAPDDRARVVVTVQATMSIPTPGQDLDDQLAALRARLRRDLEMVMPFHGEHLRLCHSPNQAGAAEGTSDELAVVAPPRPLWRPAADGALGLAGLDYATGIKHLTLASSQVLPALGLEGDLITGWTAASLASESTKTKKDFLQGEVLSSGSGG